MDVWDGEWSMCVCVRGLDGNIEARKVYAITFD